MTNTPNPLSDLSENELSSLLLDLARDRLPPAQARQVEDYAATRADLSDELACYRGLSNAHTDIERPQVNNELGWARLNKAIDQDEQASVAPAPVQSDQARISPLWRYAAVLLGVAFMGQNLLQFQQGPADRDGSRYVTVSEEPESFEIKLIFQPTSTESAIRQVLRENAGEIVAGPSALGLYTIQFKTNMQKTRALEMFSNRPDIIEQVAP